jgi:methionyl-tRNA formyltransferase
MEEPKYICIAGKNAIAVKALEFVLDSYSHEYKVIGLANQNDSGVDSWQPSFKKTLLKNEIQEVNLEDLFKLKNLVFLSLEYERIIRPNKFASKHLFNIHFSYLPSYKGMYTSSLPLLNNELYSGVTLHYIDSGIDTGKIIDQIKFPICEFDDALNLYLNYNRFAYKLLLKNLDKLLTDNFNSNEQSSKNSSYYSKKSIDYSNLNIDYNQTALSIRNQIRAFAFRPYQLPKFNKIEIRFAKITDERSRIKPNQVLEETFFYIKLSTVDYNVILFKDKLEEMLQATRDGENKLVREYIEFDYPLNDKNKQGWDLLIVATYSGNEEIFNSLIKRNVNRFTKNYNGTNLLMYALTPFEKFKKDYFFKKLLNLGLSPYLKDNNDLTTLDWIDRRKLKLLPND